MPDSRLFDGPDSAERARKRRLRKRLLARADALVAPLPQVRVRRDHSHVEEADAEAIRRALAAVDGHIPSAAAVLGVTRGVMYHRIARLGLMDWIRDTYPSPKRR